MPFASAALKSQRESFNYYPKSVHSLWNRENYAPKKWNNLKNAPTICLSILGNLKKYFEMAVRRMQRKVFINFFSSKVPPAPLPFNLHRIEFRQCDSKSFRISVKCQHLIRKLDCYAAKVMSTFLVALIFFLKNSTHVKKCSNVK